MRRQRSINWMTCCLALVLAPLSSFAAGMLTPVDAGRQPLRIADHHVEVIVNNGFARTAVIQTFFNPNDATLEAVYSFPLPPKASLAEMTILTGERRLRGEVVRRQRAEKIYQEEKAAGNDAGLATAESYQRFEFKVTPVPAQGQVTVEFVYYEPLEIDTGVGRYVYPLEEGGTDEAQASFWTRNDKVEGAFSARLTVRSAWPLDDMRLPGLGGAKIQQKAPGEWEASYAATEAQLSRDLVMYYRLADNLPGRVEVIPYRAPGGKPGTFMAVLTPGVDLQPLTGGSDYVFVLDVSGSMTAKLRVLADGVAQSIGSLKPSDRFRIVAFNGSATEITRSWTPATEANVRSYTEKVGHLKADGSTNIYDGLRTAFKGLNNDRATSVVLVTDGVTNTDVVDPKAFKKLLSKHDVRVFGFLLGNSANWPLMRVICETSGGYYKGVSNADDILGQIMLAKSKVTFEALHDVRVRIDGVKTFDLTDVPTKIYRGQQVVIFGRYQGGGTGRLTLEASLTGADKSYSTEVAFPKVDTAYPEIERLWAMDRVIKIEHLASTEKLKQDEADDAVAGLGVAYQIVTDQTAMIVLADEAFERHGIARENRARIERERDAQNARLDAPVRNHRQDRANPAFPSRAPRLGGGALSPRDAALLLLMAFLAVFVGYRKRQSQSND